MKSERWRWRWRCHESPVGMDIYLTVEHLVQSGPDELNAELILTTAMSSQCVNLNTYLSQIILHMSNRT